MGVRSKGIQSDPLGLYLFLFGVATFLHYMAFCWFRYGCS